VCDDGQQRKEEKMRKSLVRGLSVDYRLLIYRRKKKKKRVHKHNPTTALPPGIGLAYRDAFYTESI